MKPINIMPTGIHLTLEQLTVYLCVPRFVPGVTVSVPMENSSIIQSHITYAFVIRAVPYSRCILTLANKKRKKKALPLKLLEQIVWSMGHGAMDP